MVIIDNFLESFDELRSYADTAVFSDVVNPVDGVAYPLICADIPEGVKAEVIARLEDLKGSPLEGVTLFMRRSPRGVPVPHAAHSDQSMGRYSLMLYLNRVEDCQGGTSFLSHRASGISYAPEFHGFVDLINIDQNNHDAWGVREMADMAPNRAVIFDASRIHRAEPVGGFGDTPGNSRLVLTCFFS